MTSNDTGPHGRTAAAAPADADAVILVDADDRSVGTCDKLDAHKRGLLHRAFSVLVFDAARRLLLQKRAAGKYHSPGLWTNTCCGHPRPGEDLPAAAARRLEEEMGFCCPLTFVFQTRYTAAVPPDLIENEIVHVFVGRYDGDPRPDRSEIDDWRWRSLEDIVRSVAREPAVYTVWFRKYIEEFRADIAGA